MIKTNKSASKKSGYTYRRTQSYGVKKREKITLILLLITSLCLFITSHLLQTIYSITPSASYFGVVVNLSFLIDLCLYLGIGTLSVALVIILLKYVK